MRLTLTEANRLLHGDRGDAAEDAALTPRDRQQIDQWAAGGPAPDFADEGDDPEEGGDGGGVTFTPSLIALWDVGLNYIPKPEWETSAVLLNEVYCDQVMAHLRDEFYPREVLQKYFKIRERGPHVSRHGLVVTDRGGRKVHVPLGPDYLAAAEAFLRNPTEETLAADVAAYERLRAHADRLAAAG